MKCRIPEEEKKTTEVKLTAYEANKQIIAQLPPMTEEQQIDFGNKLTEYLVKTNNEYYMLLNNVDKTYYTLFRKTGDTEDEAMEDVLKEILESLGTLITWSYGPVDADGKDSLELWVKEKYTSLVDGSESEQVCCYYLFGYDAGVVEVF